MNEQTQRMLEEGAAWEVEEQEVRPEHLTAVAMTPEKRALLDTALELQAISIRLQKPLIEDLKNIGRLYGIGYQPLIRQILTRWVQAELKQIANEAMYHEKVARDKAQSSAPAQEPPTDGQVPQRKCA